MFPEHDTHTGSTAHHDDRAQFLVVADETSFAELDAALATLPLCARGRVFVEVADPSDIAVLSAPLRMVVTWLPRSTRAGRPGTGERCARGEAVARAVRAWSAEMLCDGPGATRAILLGDYRTVADVYDHLLDEVGMSPDAVSAPAHFRLGFAR